MEWDVIRAGLALLLGGVLLSAGIEDARTRLIADWKSIVIVAAAPAWWWANGAGLWPAVPVQLGMMLLTFAVFAFFFHLGAMGGGDVKLITALSLWLPPIMFMDMLLLMAVAGGVVTALMLIERRLRAGGAVEVPYGVAIAVAGLVSLQTPVLNQFG